MADLVFVYGTLKRGFPNAPVLPPHEFLGPVRTVERLPLVVAHDWYVPVLIAEPGAGHRVMGELLSVDASALEFLDRFESVGHPLGYDRTTVTVEGPNDRHEAWAYTKLRSAIDRIHEGPMPSYPLDGRYVPVDGR